MNRPLRVCFWTTTFGPDLLALAWDLDAREEFELRVAVDDPAAIAREPSLANAPLNAPLLDKGLGGLLSIKRFAPDVMVVDNGVPWLPLAPTGFVLWHGYGWKGPNDVPEMAHRYVTFAAHWGSPLRDTARMRWATFGPQDFDHRTRVGRLHPAICPQIGATSHDVLRKPIDRRELAAAYPLDVVSRRNVLVAPTWHYGAILGQWGDEESLLDELVQRARRHDANVILRLHDKFRMDGETLRVVEGLARRWDNVMLKFKNESPDGLADLQLADVLISNMSSIANLYYATGLPNIHVFPVQNEEAPFEWRRLWLGGVKSKQIASVRELWKLRPEVNGGMLARSQGDLLQQLDESLEDPTCCAARARHFVDSYMLGADGRACERVRHQLLELRDLQG